MWRANTGNEFQWYACNDPKGMRALKARGQENVMTPPSKKKKNRKEEKGILNLFGWYAEFFDYYGIVYNSTSLFTKKK